MSNTHPFAALHPLELQQIRQRRIHAGLLEGDPEKDSIALCLSGGGIRSATFNLGLLQAMERHKKLKHVDYLSTVSGGGYIGSSLTWFMSAFQNPGFPFGTRRDQHDTDEGKVLAWLRGHGNYLTPGDGLNLWALIGAVLTGTLINLAILIPVFLLLIYILSQGYGDVGPLFTSLGDAPQYLTDSGFTWLIRFGLILFGLFLAVAIFYSISTSISRFRTSTYQRFVRTIGGYCLAGSVALIVIGSIPVVHYILQLYAAEWMRSLMSLVSLSGVASVLAALKGKEGGNESKGLRAFALGVGLSLLIYGLFLWFFHVMIRYESIPIWLYIALVFSLIFAVFANINHVSMHRFYRNRLMEAYMPGNETEPVFDTFKIKNQVKADHFLLHSIGQNNAHPFHIINTNVQLVGSEKEKYRLRGGDNFIFSPVISGSKATGYVQTRDYVGGTMNLATACAISGAAVDPNTYLTRSRPLTFLMTLLNIRLGYWIRNPGHPAMFKGKLSRPRWYWYIFRELLGRGLDEKCWHIHLSDGGHFENLAMYEMVRRQCQWIIVSDASGDPEFSFSDLARVIELVRTDFGAQIELDISEIKPGGTDKISASPYAVGKIEYNDGSKGTIVYIKTALIEGLQEDVYGYHRKHPPFPDESTGDQFFDEFQFEAYRELGYQVGYEVFRQVKLC